MDIEIDIKALRARLGWSQKRLADHLGISQPSVFRMENGETKPHGATRILLAQLVEKQTDAA